MKKLLLSLSSFMMVIGLQTSQICATSHKAFYGIWLSGTKSYSEIKKTLKKVKSKGFSKAKIYITTNWTNLNSEKYYVISTNEYATKSLANAALASVKKIYRGAYVKIQESI